MEGSDEQNIQESKGSFKVIAISSQFSGDLQALDDKVKSMMEKSQNMIQSGKGYHLQSVWKGGSRYYDKEAH